MWRERTASRPGQARSRPGAAGQGRGCGHVGKRFSPSDRQRILEATDIVRLIGESVELKPKGSEYVGLCPFHDDRSPSMYVNPTLGIYKCFACGAGGRAMKFVQEFYRMDWREALAFLAERAGIEPTPEAPVARGGRASLRPRSGLGGQAAGPDGLAPVAGPGPGRAGSPGDLLRAADRHGRFAERVQDEALSTADLVEAHRTALSFYRAILRHAEHGRVAREIFARRNISAEMIDRFQLGAAPGGDHQWDGLVRTLQKRGLDLRSFEAAGLIGRRRSGDGYIDRFRNRLIFPILDRTGRPIAFGARKIDPEDEPKYLNSAEHARFHKSATLYAFDLALTEIRRTRTAVITEGYTDVIACHQAGFTNVVATLGTALTRDHCRLLQQVCDRVLLLFDGDEAGEKAVDRAPQVFMVDRATEVLAGNRAVELIFESSLDVRICLLPKGSDPADLLNDGGEAGRRAFQEAIGKGIDAFDFLMRVLRRDLERSADGLSARQRVIEAFLSRLVGLGFYKMNALRRGLILQRLADLTGLSPEMMLRAMPASSPRFATAAPAGAGAPAAAGPPRGAGGPGVREGDAASTPAGWLARFGARYEDQSLAMLRPADRARREARERTEAGVVGCLLVMRGLSSRCDHLPADHPGRALDPNWFSSVPLRRLFEAVLSVSAEMPESRPLDALEALLPDDAVELVDLATELAHWTLRSQEYDAEEGPRRLFAAYTSALAVYRADEPTGPRRSRPTGASDADTALRDAADVRTVSGAGADDANCWDDADHRPADEAEDRSAGFDDAGPGAENAAGDAESGGAATDEHAEVEDGGDEGGPNARDGAPAIPRLVAFQQRRIDALQRQGGKQLRRLPRRRDS